MYQLEIESNNKKLVAGTDWVFTQSLADYPADTYTLKHLLKKSIGDTVTLTSAADGIAHKFQIAETTTANITSGFYTVTSIVTKISDSTNIIPLEDGVFIIEVQPDLSTVSDARTFAQKMVDYYQTIIAALAQERNNEISINNQTYKRKDMVMLRKELEMWERKAGTHKRKRVLVQFQ